MKNDNHANHNFTMEYHDKSVWYQDKIYQYMMHQYQYDMTYQYDIVQ